MLCTYNGADYLAEQLASYAAQSHKAWDLWVSDDGSQDATIEILQDWKTRWRGQHDVHILKGPGQGAAANFMSLLCHKNLPAGPVALSDQDDVWYPDKICRALQNLAGLAPNQPALYGALSEYTDTNLRPIGSMPALRRAPAFLNALTQNVVSGHSAVLNRAGLALVRRAGIPTGIPFHDWWLYQLLSGAGANIIVDDRIVASYRQHQQNVFGLRRGMGAGLVRIRLVFKGTYRSWIRINLTALNKASDTLTPAHRDLVRKLYQNQDKWGWWLRLLGAGLYRQGRMETLMFYLSVLVPWSAR